MKVSALGWYDYLIAGSLGILAWLCGYWLATPGICGVFHDDAIYVATAKALATGQGYSLINLPGSPPQTKYPPLYPLVLSWVWKLYPEFPANLVFIQGLNLVIGALAVFWGYLYLRRWGYTGSWFAGLAGLLVATSPIYLYFCTLAMSEPLFALTIIAAAWCLEAYLRTSTPRWWFTGLLGLILGLLPLIRLIGVVFLPLSLVVLWRFRKPWCWPLSIGSLPLLCWAGWSSWAQMQAKNQILMYYQDYFGWWQAFGQHWWQIWSHNMFFAAAVGFGLVNPAVIPESSRLFLPIWLTAFLAGLWLLAAALRQLPTWRVLPVWLLGYLGAVFFWPWPPLRFLMPLLPFLAFYLLKSPLKLSSWFSLVGFGLYFCFWPFNLYYLLKTAEVNHRYGYPYIITSGEKLSDTVAWQDFQQLFAWLQRHTSPGDILASNLDSMLYLYTGRQGLRPFHENPLICFYGYENRLHTLEETVAALLAHEVRYLVQTPRPLYAGEIHWQRLLTQLRQRYPWWLQVVYTGRDPRFVVFYLNPAGAPGHDRHFRTDQTLCRDRGIGRSEPYGGGWRDFRTPGAQRCRQNHNHQDSDHPDPPHPGPGLDQRPGCGQTAPGR